MIQKILRLMGLDVISLLGVVLSVMPILIDLICVLSRLMGLGDVKLLDIITIHLVCLNHAPK